MTILADHEIEQRVRTEVMIDPFINRKTRMGALSHGLGSYGYDARLGTEFAEIRSQSIPISADDPPEVRKYIATNDIIIIRPGQFLLAHTLETFDIPGDVVGLMRDKSTYARLGLAVQNTVLEAGWHGQPTLELSNHGPCPIALFVGRGIVQVQFHKGLTCQRPYVGGYQGEKGVVVSAAELKGT